MAEIIITGGTFEKAYNPWTGGVDFSHLRKRRDSATYAIVRDTHTPNILMKVDSLDMTDDHRALILERCKQSPEREIVIIHGTDTMPDTANYLHKHKKHLKNKVIVLTGAMRPYRVEDSDATDNLLFALDTVSAREDGVYIAIHSEIFEPGNVTKNLDALRFERVR